MKGVKGAASIFEMTWAPNGRATFGWEASLTLVKHASSGEPWVLMMDSGLRESGEPWYTWYRNSWFALHKKRTQPGNYGQSRSVAVSRKRSSSAVNLRRCG